MTRPPDQELAQPTGQPATRPAEQLRADARQNRTRLISAATAAFAEKGADAPLEDIARRAGVGIGTLYRHFPKRIDVVEAVYVDDVDELEAVARTVSVELEPWPAFVAWLGTRERVQRPLVFAVVACNALWALDSVLLLVTGWVEPTILGEVFVLGQAAVVAVLAELEFIGLRRSTLVEAHARR